MKKVFEIPVYALTKEQLRDKFAKFTDSWKMENPQTPPEIAQRYIKIESYPQRLWEYNHIVGYITISVEGHDILFDVYLPTPHMDRYMWKSKQKHFLYNLLASGTHFYISDKSSNAQIQKATQRMLEGIIKDHIPNRFFVDCEAFDRVNGMVDYRSILQEETPNGQTKI